jgi:glutamate/aspartate transport system substrate-binding protein
VVGELLSFEPYGLMFRRDDPQFAAVVQRSFERIAITGRLAELYTRWFLKRLPDGDRMNMPMSPQLEAIFGALGAPD